MLVVWWMAHGGGIGDLEITVGWAIAIVGSDHQARAQSGKELSGQEAHVQQRRLGLERRDSSP